MEHPRSAALLAVLCLTALGCGESALAPRSELIAAEAAADAWVAANPDAWAGAVTSSAIPVRPEWTPSCSSPETNGYVSLRLRSAGGDLELSFRCPVSERSTPEELQAQFIHAVPWNLPTGVTATNFTFQAWLRLDAIYDGVTFHTPRAGSLAVDIRSDMLGIRGVSTRRGCVPAFDAVTLPEGCVVVRSHRVPMAMRFTVPADLSALR